MTHRLESEDIAGPLYSDVTETLRQNSEAIDAGRNLLGKKSENSEDRGASSRRSLQGGVNATSYAIPDKVRRRLHPHRRTYSCDTIGDEDKRVDMMRDLSVCYAFRPVYEFLRLGLEKFFSWGRWPCNPNRGEMKKHVCETIQKRNKRKLFTRKQHARGKLMLLPIDHRRPRSSVAWRLYLAVRTLLSYDSSFCNRMDRLGDDLYEMKICHLTIMWLYACKWTRLRFHVYQLNSGSCSKVIPVEGQKTCFRVDFSWSHSFIGCCIRTCQWVTDFRAGYFPIWFW